MKLDPALKQQLKNQLERELKEARRVVKLTLAYTPSEEEVRAIMARFPQFAGGRVVVEKDESIISGFIVSCGSKVIDLSIKSQLNTIR